MLWCHGDSGGDWWWRMQWKIKFFETILLLTQRGGMDIGKSYVTTSNKICLKIPHPNTTLRKSGANLLKYMKVLKICYRPALFFPLLAKNRNYNRRFLWLSRWLGKQIYWSFELYWSSLASFKCCSSFIILKFCCSVQSSMII